MTKQKLTKEQTLSDKETRMFHVDTTKGIYHREDVKEFIERIIQDLEENNKENGGLSFYDARNIIRNRVGDKLIK